MESNVQKRLVKLGKVDLICSLTGLVFHVAAIIVVICVTVKNGYPPSLHNSLAQTLFWILVVFFTFLRLILVYSAYRFYKVVDKTDLNSTIVMKRFRQWNNLNILTIVVHIFTMANIFSLVYNCCLVYICRSVKKDLETHVQMSEQNFGANNVAFNNKIV